MSFLDQLLDSIDARVDEATEEIAALQGALAALRSGPALRRAAPAAKAPAALKAPKVAVAPPAQPATPASQAQPATPAPPEAPAEPAVTATSGRSRPGFSAAQLEAMLGESTEGLSAITLSKRAGVGYNQVLTLLRQLEATDRVRRTGARRTSLWRAVTDEERIAERAAELASR